MSNIKLKKHKPEKVFSRKNKVVQALAEALLEGDAEAVQDILCGFLLAQNKKELAIRANLSRATIYNAMKGNPSLKTLVEILKHAA